MSERLIEYPPRPGVPSRASEPADVTPPDDPETTTVLGLGLALRRRWRTIAVVALALAPIGMLAAFFSNRDYTATAQFLGNSSQSSASRLAGLASQFGMDVGSLGALAGGGGSDSPELYARLVMSHEILRQTALATYRFPKTLGGTDTVSGNLIALYRKRESSPAATLNETIRQLERNILVGSDSRSGIVTVRTRERWAGLAEQINARLLALVIEFNQVRRHSRGEAERKFTEERLDAVRQELASAEAAQRDFLMQNRVYQTSPQLTLLAAKLQRNIDLKQQVVTSLTQAYEQARSDEVRDTPVITVVDPPAGTALRRFRLWAGALSGAVLGALLAVGLILLQEYLAHQRREAAAGRPSLDRIT